VLADLRNEPCTEFGVLNPHSGTFQPNEKKLNLARITVRAGNDELPPEKAFHVIGAWIVWRVAGHGPSERFDREVFWTFHVRMARVVWIP
jgi:hypothetical protein